MSSLAGKQILVIDDDRSVGDLVSLCLSEAGAVVVVSDNAQDGLKKAAASPFDLVLLDLVMPDFDGMTLLKTVQLTVSKPPIVILSSVESRRITEQAVQEGAYGFVHKPIHASTFAGQIAEILQWTGEEPDNQV
jgi:DNA-binding response OmpR family regulator